MENSKRLVFWLLLGLGMRCGADGGDAASSSAAVNSAFNIRPLSIFTGNCNASVPRGATVWKRTPAVVDVFFPKVKPPQCASPSSCSVNFSSTLHANVILQPGDSLKLTFDLDFSSSPSPTGEKASAAELTTQSAPKSTWQWPKSPAPTSKSTSESANTSKPTPQPESTSKPTTLPPGSAPVSWTTVQATAPLATASIVAALTAEGTTAGTVPTTTALLLKRYPRQADPADASGKNTTGRPPLKKTNLVNMVTLYKVNWEAFDSCDISSGQRVGQVKSQDASLLGSITLPPSLLAIEDNYFLGRSLRWGGECLKVKASVKTANCGDGDLCANNGVCYATTAMGSFQCSCCESVSVNEFCGPSNLCAYNPCQNQGVCVRHPHTADDDAFRCLCMPGYEGKFCEERFNACDAMVCHNGGTCVMARDGRPHCSCPPGFVGLHCEEELTGCDSSPCIHGICVDQPHGYRCFCQPGFGGPQCNFEYNECESSPCLNGGSCLDRVGGFQCHCPAGFTGSRCETQTHPCQPNPCGRNQKCIDHGNNVSCECIPGLDPALCAEMSSACSPNPCLRGGTCWVSSGTYFCACQAGYTGDRCQDTASVAITGEEVQQQERSLNRQGVQLGELQMKTPISLHLDHTHSLYVAIGTLVSAVLIVIATVSICYCRVHETYKRWSPRRLPSLCRDYRVPSPSKSDHGMDVPLAVAMETEILPQQRNKSYQNPSSAAPGCRVYLSESHRDLAVLD